MIRQMPVEPAPCRWALPIAGDAVSEVAGIGADLEPGTLLAAYRAGLFPMRLHAGGPLAWWSPDPRGILPLDVLRAGGGVLLDVQWTTPHLMSLGAIDIPRDAYQRLLDRALAHPLPAVFAGPVE